MKHMIFGVSLAILTVLVIAGVMIISGKDVRENEMDKALNTAVEQALEQIGKEGSYEIADSQELIADFSRELLLHISSDSTISVSVLTADTEKGVLDIEIMETYKTAKGATKQASCRKTVFLEHYAKEAEYYTVDFLLDGDVYAEYTMCSGSLIPEPEEPAKAGHVFRGWICQGTGAFLDNEMAAEADMTFEAVFE